MATRPIVDPGLAEIALGRWEGKTGAQIDAETGGGWSRLDRHDWFFQCPDGERFAPFEARLAAALARVEAHAAPIRIIVSHGVAGRILRGLHLGLSRPAMNRLPPMLQGAIFQLATDGITRIDCQPA